MPRRYLSVNVSEEQQQFIRLLDDYEIDIFARKGAKKRHKGFHLILNASDSDADGLKV